MDPDSKSLEKWRNFFASMADGLLPYIQLYVKRNQRGSGLGNFVSSRYRYQVPVVIDNSSQIGRGGPYNRNVRIVNPTQTAVDQAKSIITQENNDLREMIHGKTIKRKHSSVPGQKKIKHASKRKKETKSKKSSKQSFKKNKTKVSRKQFEDIFS